MKRKKVRRPSPHLCSATKCYRPMHGRGYCQGHYQRLINGLVVDVELGKLPKRFPKRNEVDWNIQLTPYRPISAADYAWGHYGETFDGA